MNKEKVVELMALIGAKSTDKCPTDYEGWINQFKKFAELVEAYNEGGMDIAEQLAWRDKEIERLRGALKRIAEIEVGTVTSAHDMRRIATAALSHSQTLEEK